LLKVLKGRELTKLMAGISKLEQSHLVKKKETNSCNLLATDFMMLVIV